MTHFLHTFFAFMHQNRVTVFGLVAVSLMLVFYWLENRRPIFVLAFSGACLMGAAYGFLQGAWPFGLVESVWAFVAFRRWWMMPTPAQIAAAQPDQGHVKRFLEGLHSVAPSAGRGTFAFPKPEGGYHGYVQFIIDSPTQVTIHRIWSDTPNRGSGSHMMRTLCDLADEHGVTMKLKVLPIGRKPYPMNPGQLYSWYQSHGFHGKGRKMCRCPRPRSEAMRSRNENRWKTLSLPIHP
jgi:hypothetical protein